MRHVVRHAEPGERRRRRQAAAAAVARPRRGRGARRRRASASGSGRATSPGSTRPTPRHPCPTSCMACAGDVPTMEAVAAAQLLRDRLPDLRVRVVNVVDLMRLQDPSHHPHGLNDLAFDAIFTRDVARDLRVPRVPVAHPPARLPAHEPREPARARVHRAGHHDHAVRHAAPQRPRPLPARARRAPPRARARRAARASPRSPTSGTPRGRRRASTRTSTARTRVDHGVGVRAGLSAATSARAPARGSRGRRARAPRRRTRRAARATRLAAFARACSGLRAPGITELTPSCAGDPRERDLGGRGIRCRRPARAR